MLSEYFDRSEFACKCGCGFDTVDVELLRVLEKVRHHFGQPITITSGCRCSDHNKKVGGTPTSQHLLGRAADISVKNVLPPVVQAHLEGRYKGYGIGKYNDFTHIDTRGQKARW